MARPPTVTVGMKNPGPFSPQAVSTCLCTHMSHLVAGATQTAQPSQHVCPGSIIEGVVQGVLLPCLHVSLCCCTRCIVHTAPATPVSLLEYDQSLHALPLPDTAGATQTAQPSQHACPGSIIEACMRPPSLTLQGLRGCAAARCLPSTDRPRDGG